ncbi:MAG: hypothetical protein IBX72_11485 [Nitrospirae bacterium]|nr:hypothetical protein [Nitrospirota bacterium]
MIEIERTYLARYIPEGLRNCDCSEVVDIYIPADSVHPKLRIRKNGRKHEINKKQPVQGNDASHQMEQTIKITEDEFNALSIIAGKKIHKVRYYYPYNGRTAEIDVFQGPLEGLVLVDFEFKTTEEKDNFVMPDFCMADVTQEEFIAGGMLCGKSYEEISDSLKKFNYSKLSI